MGGNMFINGTREWIGDHAQNFLYTRTALEQKLLNLGYEYFYGGIISKRSIYESHSNMLGMNFGQILIDFSYKEEQYIFTPEYTFRVYEYLNRNGFLDKPNKVFYSQEMLRNEPAADIQKGKTFSFWQIGYEIFGQDDTSLSIECMSTLVNCLQELSLDRLYFRFTDKRILDSLCRQFSVNDKKKVLSIMEECDEDGDIFCMRYIQEGGNTEFAQELKQLLNLSRDRKLTFSILKESVKEVEALKAIDNLEVIYRAMSKRLRKENLVLVPLMPKTWDAYTTFICDARLDGYDKAIGGGGNLFIDPLNPYCVHSGAGIGVTRIADYLISRDLNLNSRRIG